MTQAWNLSQLANKINTSGQLDAATGLSGQLNASTGLSGTTPIANGGTGASTLTANSVMIGNGTGAIQFVAPSTSGNALVSNGTSWISSTPAAPAALSTATGLAPSYSARAWVNFNGQGTPSIRGSQNVSSITDNGTGNYSVVFITAMPDANYATVGCAKQNDNASFSANNRCFAPYGALTTSASLLTIEANAGSAQDCANIMVSIFR